MNYRNNIIHRIDTNIVNEYVSTIYKDYNLRKRFGDFDNSVIASTNNILVQQYRPPSVRNIDMGQRYSVMNRPC